MKGHMRILSGIQPTGILHIGNYFGMMRPAIALQDEGEALYFIADYHALTSLRDPLALRENSRRVALDFIACGLNPDKSALFRQSDVRQVTELAWILSTVTPVSRLELAHSYKDKIARGAPAAAGLFTYPVLMAADILIYDSDIVPVGKDQKQHLEIARDIATRINETFGSKREGRVLKLPEARIQAQTEVVPGIDGQKMSKSYGNTIDLTDDDASVTKKVRQMYTDPKRVRADVPGTVEGNPVFMYHDAFNTNVAEVDDLKARYRAGKVGDVEVKTKLAAAMNAALEPVRARRREVMARPDHMREVLVEGSRRARVVAQATMERVRDAMKLRY